MGGTLGIEPIVYLGEVSIMSPIWHGAPAVALTVSLLGLTGCVQWEPAGPTRTESRSVELDKSELVDVMLRMGAGEMNVRGGSPKLMEAEFRYNRPHQRPEVHYDASGFRGHLLVEEPSRAHH